MLKLKYSILPESKAESGLSPSLLQAIQRKDPEERFWLISATSSDVNPSSPDGNSSMKMFGCVFSSDTHFLTHSRELS
jgi:hypothetical protein